MKRILVGGSGTMGGEASHARQFFSGYFHQDCLVDDPDWESIVLRFRQSEPFDVVRTTQTELEQLLARSNESDLEKFLLGRDLLCYYDPRSSGFTLTDWLREIIHLLAGGSHSTGDRAAIAHARRQAASIARQALDDNLDPIVASRQLSALRWSVGLDENDPDFITFVAIDSETDALPVEAERHRWSAAALTRLDPEITKARDWARSHGRQAFENVVRRFGNAG